MKFNCAYDELVDLHRLQPNPRNRNNHPQKQIDMLAKIIDYQGQRSPIVVSTRSGFITKGHGRLQALQKLGWTQAAVDYQDYESEAQEYADLIADNKIAELSEHDDLKILDDIKELDLFDLDFDLLGMADFSFVTELASEPLDEEKEPDKGPEKYVIEVSFPNDMEMNDVKDDLLSRGYIVKVKK